MEIICTTSMLYSFCFYFPELELILHTAVKELEVLRNGYMTAS